VTNFEETTNVLESNGVTLNVQRDGWSNIAHFADPDGNPLYVIEVK
jgi:hypothetical protein